MDVEAAAKESERRRGLVCPRRRAGSENSDSNVARGAWHFKTRSRHAFASRIPVVEPERASRVASRMPAVVPGRASHVASRDAAVSLVGMLMCR
jgi:hypothetical protein